VTNGIGGPRCPTWSGRTKAGGVQAVLTLGANKNENVTVVFADVEAIPHIDITSIGEEVQPAGNQTCRGDSLDVDGPGDQDRVAGSRRNGPQPAMWASRDGRAAGLCRWSVASRSWLHEPDAVARPFPALSRHQHHRPICRTAAGVTSAISGASHRSSPRMRRLARSTLRSAIARSKRRGSRR